MKVFWLRSRQPDCWPRAGRRRASAHFHIGIKTSTRLVSCASRPPARKSDRRSYDRGEHRDCAFMAVLNQDFRWQVQSGLFDATGSYQPGDTP